ncbi:MAG: hypothetical protein HQK54_01425 [Oligoflexales bacterium]|nr:hypothetical protein [Oligoflexales bacterium]
MKSDFLAGKNYTVLQEVTLFVLCTLTLVLTLRQLLLYGNTTFTHDHLYWGYPIFQFFAENIVDGRIPLWNPFSHGGEPFYLSIVIQRLLCPIPLLIVLIGKYFTHDAVLLYNWCHVTQNIVMISGIYLFFRPLIKITAVKYSLIPILFFSSIFFSSFHQAASLYQFIWTPYALIFFYKIVVYRKSSLANWLMLAFFIGLSWQSYFFAGILSYLFFFSIAFLVKKENFIGLISTKNLVLKISCSGILLILMLLPNIVVVMDKDDYVFPARAEIEMNIPYISSSTELSSGGGIKMPYQAISISGAFMNVWDFLQTLDYRGNRWIRGGVKGEWGRSSEMYLYIGIFPWFISLWGLFIGKSKDKKIWIFVTLTFALLVIGPTGVLHPVLYHIFPPLWFVRNLEGFSLFVLMGFLYFYILGFESLYRNLTKYALPLGLQFGNIFTYRRAKKLTLMVIYSTILIYITQISLTITEEHATNIHYATIVFMIATTYFFNFFFRKENIVLAIFVSQIFIVLLNSTEQIILITRLSLFFFLPWIIFLCLKFFIKYMNIAWFRNCVIGIISFSTTADLLEHLGSVSYLYQAEKNPTLSHPSYGFNTKMHQPVLSQSRYTTPQEYFNNRRKQVIRYPEILKRQTYAFSPAFGTGPSDINKVWENELHKTRWNSFYYPLNYYRLIRSSLPPNVIKEALSIDKPLIQFKHGFIQANLENLTSYLQQYTDDEQGQLLNNYFFILKNSDPMSSAEQISLFDSGGRSVPLSSLNIKISQANSFKYTVKKYNYNSIEMEVFSEENGFLYWADGYNSRWQAHVDNKPADILNANVDFKAIAISKGVSMIKFDFDHWKFIVSLYIFYGTILTALILITVTYLINLKGYNVLKRQHGTDNTQKYNGREKNRDMIEFCR